MKDFYIQCSQLGKRAISAKVVYNVEVKLVDDQTPIGCTCHKDEIAMLETVTAFEVTIKLSSLKVSACRWGKIGWVITSPNSYKKSNSIKQISQV